ncbi:hypothetical protein BRARA_H01272 [Brassica rapa]|uniref:Uncharacterized protein n=1 Tax=Brassica campestris TaxID=3711 RepID=A0A397YCG3_BRACM|nr:hypothetical protein BRARA_H01272 [Brassica rapa]
MACVSSSYVLNCLARVPTLACVSLSSLPEDLVLNCLARVPTSYDQTLACFCKNFQSLVLSGELAQMRSLLAAIKDYPLLCVFYTEFPRPGWTKLHWIYFVGGSDCDAECSSGLVIFDSRSGKLSTGPSMKGAGVAVVDGKIYVMGGCQFKFNEDEDEINQVEVFDPNTQTWEVGPLGPHGEITYGKGYKWNQFREAVALDGMVYGMSFLAGYHTIYDTKDGTCENLEISHEYTMKISKACVVNSLIYVFYHEFGLMWYDSKEKIWKRVKGLRCDVGRHHVVECNGKLALLWEDSEEKIWCAMIAMDKVGVEIHGRVEWSEFVGYAHRYSYWSCLGLSL